MLSPQSGRTPLYIAARGSHTAIVDILIKADRMRSNRCGTSGNSNNCSRKSSIERNTSIESNETQSTYARDCPSTELGESYLKQIKELLWSLSRNHLEVQDWKRLAKVWDFTDEHIKAIEHQYTGKTSYKEHSYRMMLIWLHGLPASKNPLKELVEGLTAIGKKDIAGKLICTMLMISI